MKNRGAAEYISGLSAALNTQHPGLPRIVLA